MVAPPRVTLIDPSNFTLPYDHCLCEALEKQGCDVTLIRSPFIKGEWKVPATYKTWELFYPVSHGHLRFMARGFLWRSIKVADHALSMVRLVRAFRRSPPHVIHFQWLPAPSLDLYFLRRLRRIARLFFTVHDTTPFHGAAGSRLQTVGYWRLLPCFDGLIVHTHYSRERLLSLGQVSPERVHVVPHGVLDYYRMGSRTSPAQHEERRPPRTILFFGAIQPYKGLDVLIEAFSRLPEKIRTSCRLLIAGYPYMSVEPLKRKSNQLGLDAQVVWRLGFVPEGEVPTLFDQADVVVLPYRDADQSGVLMTAFGFGKPVIASRVGGFEEVLGQEASGVLVKPGDPADLARTLESVLTDPIRLQKMRETIGSLARSLWSWESIAAETVRLYRLVLQTPPAKIR